MKAAWIWGIAALWVGSACGSVADESDGGASIDAPDNGIDAATDIADAAPAPDAMWECISNFDCDDTQRCTTDTCNVAHECSNTPLDGVPVPGAIQPMGDCKVLSCVSGAEMMVDDDADIPVDGLECTKDECNSGVPSNPPESSGTTCSAGTCDGFGNCTGCTVPSDCGADTFCRQFTCSGGTCGVVNTADGTPLPAGMQTTGDCRRVVCNGSGGTREEELDSDLPPDDGLECTFETCFMGAPLHPPRAINTPCSTGFCDGDGACVECNNASQCSGAPVCKVNQCNSNMCDVDDEPAGTPAPPSVQTPGDCQVEVCNGTGGYSPVDDSTDVPVDGLECTDDVCSGGTPSNPPRAIHTPCSMFGGTACDGEGMCVECTMDIHCGSGIACNLATFTCGCPGGDCGGLDCDGDSISECGPEIPFCCGVAPFRKCAFEHDNGLGEKWYDCTALGTYNEEQAYAACGAHFAGDPTACYSVYGMCGGGGSFDGGVKVPPPGDAGTGFGDVVCGSGTLGSCWCWQFNGSFAGYVNVAGACGCPSSDDSMWY